MKTAYLRTSDLARGVGVHPNTVRMYEDWGFLPSVSRTRGGHRRFTEAHLDQMRLIRTGMAFTWLGGEIRRAVFAMLRQAAEDDAGGALERAYGLLVMIQSERVQAEAAASLLERWARGTATDATAKSLWIGQVAELLDVSADVLRNWERDGLIEVPRDPHNGYRLYGPAEIGRLRVIRTLRRARYSTMAVLRMLVQLDEGRRENLRQALDTPRDDEDIRYATDQWLSTLSRLEPEARDLIAQLEATIERQALGRPPAHRRGRELVVARYAEALALALDCVAPQIPLADCRLFGTAAALLQGAYPPVRDLNLLVRGRAQVDAASAALANFPCPAPPAFDPETRVYAVTHKIRGIAVRVAAIERAVSVDGVEDAGPGPWRHCAPVACGAHTVAAVALELRLATELARGRARRYITPLVRHLRAHGFDRDLLHRALQARALPNDLQERILRKLR